jgi:hypothetical protein
MIPKERILDIVYKSGLHDLLIESMKNNYKYESLTCNLGYGCKITFEINTDGSK